MTVGVADVFSGVFLRADPARLTRNQFHLDLAAVGADAPLEGGQRNQDGIWMAMPVGAFSGFVAVLQDSHPIVFEDDLVALRVGDDRVGAHGRSFTRHGQYGITVPRRVGEYHLVAMTVPYEVTGRRGQKARTRAALIAATRVLLGQGLIPTVEDAASAADISRTTAYRYFPNQRALLSAVRPEIDQTTVLPDPAPTDPAARLELAMVECVRINLEWEPELRTSLRLSLEPGHTDWPVLRGGRVIGWIEDALAPLHQTRPDIDTYRLAIAIRSATGIESFIWLVDVAGLSRPEAADVLRHTAQALLAQALAGASRRP